MGIAKFIRDNTLTSRLKEAECLVVYDPDRRYRDLCLEMGNEEVAIVDASMSSIESREKAQQAFKELGTGNLKGLLIYVLSIAPITDEQKQVDPFSVYAECGALFPNPITVTGRTQLQKRCQADCDSITSYRCFSITW